MSLFKRGSVWWSYFYEDGIRHQSSTGTSNRRQAETIEAKLKEEVTNQRFQIVKADPAMTFGELAARFIASGSVRPHHLYHLKFLLPFFSETPVLRLYVGFLIRPLKVSILLGCRVVGCSPAHTRLGHKGCGHGRRADELRQTEIGKDPCPIVSHLRIPIAGHVLN